MLPRLAFRICIDQRADHALIGDTPLLSCALEELYTAARQPERHLRRGLLWYGIFTIDLYGSADATPHLRFHSVRRAQPVADAGLGEHVVRAFGIGLDLLSQLAHIDAQILRIGQIVP